MKKNILLLAFVVLTSLQLSAQTGDPWIKKVYNATWGRNPTALEYNIYNYHNGQWNNYNELMNYIYEYQKNLNANGLSFKYSSTLANNRVVVGVFKNNTQIAADLISNDGGSIVAQGGGNIISTGGAGIVAQGGGNIVAQGGGNIAVNANVKGLSFGPSSTKVLAAGGMVIPTSGGTAFIIK
jgi:hypothetical protein